MPRIANRKRRLHAIIFLTASAYFSYSSTGVASTCDQSKAQRALAELSRANDWGLLHVFYSEYSSCDDGGLADDLTERVVRLFNTHWSELHSLSAVTQKDQKFLKFVLSHIDSTADTADLSKLYKSAKQNCPANTALLCRQISDAAKKALN